MSEEKSSPIGTLIGVALIVGLIGYFIGKPNTTQQESVIGKPNTTQQESEFLKQGLVAYYPFNGNTKDESGNGNDGELNGPILTKDRHGNAERAYSFDGIDDYITLPSSIFEEVDGFTLSAWVNLNSPRLVHTIISGALAGNDNKLFIGTSLARRFCISYIGQNQWSFPAEDLMGEWKHIVVTKLSRQPTFIVFVDGLLKAEMNFPKSGPLKFAPNGLMIGPEQDSAGGGFQANQLLMGDVDDYRIYNRALSAEEVKALYDLEKSKED